MFKYCSYWHTWNRILAQKDGWTVELDLTPVNGFGREYPRGQIALEVIRCHCTSPGEKDKFVDELPSDIYIQMVGVMGEELVEKLLTYNYMDEVSFENIREAGQKSNGGGVPFEFVCKARDGVAEFHHWDRYDNSDVRKLKAVSQAATA